MENRYDKYKDSGIAWIGEIPEHWEVKRLKNVCSTNNASLSDKTSEEFEFDYVDIGSVSFELGIHKTEKYTFQNAPSRARKIARLGDIIVSTVRTYLRAIDIINSEEKEKYIYSTGFAILSPLKNILSEFMIYICRSEYFTNQVSIYSTGINYPSINDTALKMINIVIPTLSEQQPIATYLDQKCGKIDELITLQEEMITKLQSYKQSVITEAVTKGLDKNVPLKDSGIEWIGETPEHWNIIKTKNAFKIISGATPKTDNMTYWDGEITWITPADYKTEDRVIKSGKRNITLAGLNSCGTSIVPENSIIFSKRAPIGLVAINIVPLCTNQGCISCIPKSFVNSKYFYYLMSVLTEWFELFGSGTTFKELSTNNFANFSLSQPPLSEQQSIADYLDQKCSEIDELISIKQQKIEKLKDYKKSLIFECVTGKRKVS